MLNSQGRLAIRALTAGGALPVEGTVVRIIGAEEANRLVAYSLLTDLDGLTESAVLPAPNIEYSLSPDPAELPYATYDVEISAPGYFSRRIYGVSVFSGVDSILPIAMIPLSDGDEQNYPIGSINATITQNAMLE